MQIDSGKIEQLRELGGDGFLQELYITFLSTSEKIFVALRQARAANDVDAIRNHCHALRGSAVNLGLIAIEKEVSSLHDAARQGQIHADFDATLERLEKMAASDIAGLQRLENERGR